MRQFFDIYGSPEFPKIILKNIEEENIALVQDGDITGFTPTLQFTGTPTISFTIEDSVEKPQIEYYDNIMLNNRIYVDGLDKERIFVIKECEETTDNVTKTKNVMAIALEADMNNPLTLLAGTYTFFDPLKPEESLMHIITKQNAEWSIGEIDIELSIMKFKFEEITMPTYQFLMTNVSEAYECVFSYDEINKKINATTNGKSTKNKNIVLKYDDIIESVTKTPNAEKFTTAMEVVGGGGLSIATVNPLGTNTIYNFNGVIGRMSVTLRDAVVSWDTKIKASQKTYADKLTILNNKNAEMQTLKTQQVNIQAIRDAKKEAMSVYVETGNTNNPDYRNLVDEYNKAIRDDVAKQAEIDTKKAEIDVVFAELKAINESLSLANNFTPQQIVLLSRYIYTTKVTDENYIQTDRMSNKEIQDMAQRLYDKYTLVLEKHCKELVSVTVSMNNFMRCLERRDYTNNIELGDVITIQMMEDTYADLTVLEVTWNYDDIETMSMTFADGLRLVGRKYENAEDSIRQSVIDATVKGELVGWTEASKNNSFLNDIQNGGLDANLTAIKSNDKEEIKIDNTGLMARSYDKDLNTYSKEQLWLVHNQILLTDDSWETVKCAIGKLLFADGTTWGYGISSDLILGKILCGQRCIIQSGNTYVTIDELGIKVENGAIEIKDKNGNAFIDGEKITLGDGKVGMTTYDDGLQDVPDLRIWAGSNDYDSRDTALFRVYEDGRVVMMNAEVHGDIITPDGGICNHGMGDDALFYGGSSHDDRNSAKFRVTHKGDLYAENAKIKGEVACSKLLLNGEDILTNNASQIDSKYIANLEVGSIKADTARIDTMWSKNLFVEKFESGFSDLLYIKGDTKTVVNSMRIYKERQDWVSLDVDPTQSQEYVIDDNGVSKNVYYVYMIGENSNEWFTFSSMYDRAIEWQPKTSYPKHQVVYSGGEYKYIAIDDMPNTIETWSAIDGSIALPVDNSIFKVKIKKILKTSIKKSILFNQVTTPSGLNTVMPIDIWGEGSETVSPYGDRRGQSSQLKDGVGMTWLQNMEVNNNKLGFRMNVVNNTYEVIDPVTQQWVKLAGGKNNASIVVHNNNTPLTSKDLTGGTALHVAPNTTTPDIIGEYSDLYLPAHFEFLGLEKQTKVPPFVPIPGADDVMHGKLEWTSGIDTYTLFTTDKNGNCYLMSSYSVLTKINSKGIVEWSTILTFGGLSGTAYSCYKPIYTGDSIYAFICVKTTTGSYIPVATELTLDGKILRTDVINSVPKCPNSFSVSPKNGYYYIAPQYGLPKPDKAVLISDLTKTINLNSLDMPTIITTNQNNNDVWRVVKSNTYRQIAKYSNDYQSIIVSQNYDSNDNYGTVRMIGEEIFIADTKGITAYTRSLISRQIASASRVMFFDVDTLGNAYVVTSNMLSKINKNGIVWTLPLNNIQRCEIDGIGGIFVAYNTWKIARII